LTETPVEVVVFEANSLQLCYAKMRKCCQLRFQRNLKGIDSTFQQFWKMIPKGLPERVGFGGFGPSTTMVTMAENFKARP